MNKDLNNYEGKSNQRVQIHNHSTRQNGTFSSEAINLNRESKSKVSESGDTQNTGWEKRIHPVESSFEKKQIVEKKPLDASVEKNQFREKNQLS